MPDIHPGLRGCSALLVATLLTLATVPARGAVTDISAAPISSKSNVSAKPNLMFVLDDSGSMAWTHMPDELGTNGTPKSNVYGYFAPQCNGLAFDPNLPYNVPVQADGTPYPASSITNAPVDGYDAASPKVNLTTNGGFYAYTGTQPKLGWTYAADGSVDTSTTFYRECMSDRTGFGAEPGRSKFTYVAISSRADLEQKFANWYSYYRARYMLMRSAVGLAVKQLDDKYRVGFSRINSTSYTDGADFRDVKLFNAAQKQNFYSSLYGANPGGGTPLRGALSKIGRYYAKKLPSQSYDPVEYACQRNYAILTTDGYWNGGGSPGVTEGSSYGPLDLSGNLVGNTDSSEVRPMYDGGSSVRTASTPTTTVRRSTTVTRTRTTVTSNRTVRTVTGTSCFFGFGRLVRVEQQRKLDATTATRTVVSDITEVKTRVVVTTNGTVTSDTEVDSPPSSAAVSNTLVSDPTVLGTFSTISEANPRPCELGATNSTSPAIADPAITDTLSTNTTSTPVSGPTVGATTITNTSSGGSSDTLSDVAQYYYATDLRNASLGNCASKDAANVVTDVCSNIVPPADASDPLADNSRAQHMTTFTIGLGVNGTLSPGDFAGLKSGSKNWPPTTTTISGSSGDARNIDDLWHAAVNGRGKYYSALGADDLSKAIAGVVSAIDEASGSASASSFNTLALVSGLGNRVYQAGYTSGTWIGDLNAYQVAGETGETGALVWSARAKLDAKSWSTRSILYRRAPGTATLRDFNYANLNADGYADNFANLCSKSVVASQCAGLAPTTTNRVLADTSTNLINYLRGDRSYEETNSTSPLYRTRESLLGDIIHGAPVYVGKPPFAYADGGYAAFAAGTAATRTAMVYAGANDGMLHAFSAETGDELWAYVPTAVMPNMYKLANRAYSGNHAYFVDGEPVVGDIYADGAWKTILVGGLGSGGRMVYALDITDPLAPKSLWEFTDTNLGLTHGNPIITKRADGTWVVVFASGYNNVSPGNGKGRLYVLNANTGSSLLQIETPAGSTTTPSGLAKINGWVDAATDNTSKRFYGGDLLGNLWRFDIDNLVAPNQGALLLAELQTASGVPEPITVKPETALIAGTYPAVAIGTGRYLGESDIADTTTQSMYVLKDSLTNTGIGVARSTDSGVVKHTLTLTGKSATASTESVVWATNNGWFFDFPNTGERLVTNMAVTSGILTLASTIPSGNVCTSGGSSWLYIINLASGFAANDAASIGVELTPESVIVGLTAAKLSDGRSFIFIKDSKGEVFKRDLGGGSVPPAGPPRRTSWRELIN